MNVLEFKKTAKIYENVCFVKGDPICIIGWEEYRKKNYGKHPPLARSLCETMFVIFV